MTEGENIELFLGRAEYYFGFHWSLGLFWLITLCMALGVGYRMSRFIHRDRIDNLSKGSTEKQGRIVELEEDRRQFRESLKKYHKAQATSSLQWAVVESDFKLINLGKDLLQLYSKHEKADPKKIRQYERVLVKAEAQIKDILENTRKRSIELATEGSSSIQEVDSIELKKIEEKFELAVDKIQNLINETLT